MRAAGRPVCSRAQQLLVGERLRCARALPLFCCLRCASSDDRSATTVVSFQPCLPSHWPQAELTLKRDGRTMRFIFVRGSEAGALAMAVAATLLQVGESVEWTKLADDSTFIIPLQPL